jgi:hypothetical protein
MSSSNFKIIKNLRISELVANELLAIFLLFNYGSIMKAVVRNIANLLIRISDESHFSLPESVLNSILKGLI